MDSPEQAIEKIVCYALSLGFDLVHCSSPEFPARHHDVFKEWICKGYHGSMEYLSRRLEERKHVNRLLPETKSILTLAVNYYYEDQRQRKSHEGWISRYAMRRDYHKVIRKKLQKLGRFIQDSYGLHIHVKECIDTSPILERACAETSQLGYIGKNTCLITEEYGSWVFLAELLTTLPLPNYPIVPHRPKKAVKRIKMRCGTCSRCILQCPTGAIRNDFTIDAKKCISYLTIENKGAIPVPLREKIGYWLFGCDICQEVCPHNHTRQVHVDPQDQAIRIKDRVLSLQEIMSIETDDVFLALFAGTPLMRAKRRGLIRNACIVAGNTGDPSLLPILKRLALGKDTMIQEHALWAIKKINLTSGFSSPPLGARSISKVVDSKVTDLK